MVLPSSCATESIDGSLVIHTAFGRSREDRCTTRNDLQIKALLGADQHKRRHALRDVVLALGKSSHEDGEILTLGELDSQAVTFENPFGEGRVHRQRCPGGKHRHAEWGEILPARRSRVFAATDSHKRRR